MEENKRNFFRLKFFDTPISVKYDLRFTEKTATGRIKDISGNGISFYLPKKVVIEKSELLELTFSIKEEIFTVNAFIVRIEDKVGEKVYACNYQNLPESLKSKISSALFILDAKRRK